uniref:C-type lectin domain-containing protein n=1 Tax=Seriola lalandi dorsalis TaxID=1841481 RepID=A0A3B4YBJ4_SERLL
TAESSYYRNIEVNKKKRLDFQGHCFCITSAHFPHIYYFIEERMTWFEARDYCLSKNSAIAQIYNNEYLTEMMNTPTGGYTDKAWIGLFENTSEWTWVDGQLATYFHWNTDQTNSTNATKFCVIMTDGGFWSHISCSNERPSVCFNGGYRQKLG